MKGLLRNKIVTTLVVTATFILAGVAVFTATRLYQLRQSSVSQPLAWDCSKYVFSVSPSGVVTVKNDSTHNEPTQQAKVYINNSLVTTLSVPALSQGQNATLGTVQVPQGGFSWRVEGTLDCSSSGTAPQACTLLTFTITSNTGTPTPTTPPGSTATSTPTNTPTPTVTPTTPPGSTATPTTPPGSTATPTTPPGSTATPTTIAQNSPTTSPTTVIALSSPTTIPGAAAGTGGENLPAAGIALPTLFAFGLGSLILVLAVILAL
jgi:hypothetical protein